jgi:hypothetical protein
MQLADLSESQSVFVPPLRDDLYDSDNPRMPSLLRHPLLAQLLNSASPSDPETTRLSLQLPSPLSPYGPAGYRGDFYMLVRP